MASSRPTVMISSTYYDLKQVRRDMQDFLEDELGYDALLSEHNSFPIDPDAGTVENCRRRVQQNADILVLIVGGRYGYIDSDSDKSVTNLEYLTARAEGLPVFAFIDRSVLALLPVWKNNAEGDFSSSVDNTKVFEFIEKLRNEDNVWTQEFGAAQDIIEALRIQFAYQMSRWLVWSRRLSVVPGDITGTLRGRSLRLALEQPDAWEYSLLTQVLIDEIHEHDKLRQAHRLGHSLGGGGYVSFNEIPSWMQGHISELRRLTATIDALVNDTLQVALRPAGTPGDVKEIVSVARQIAECYKHAIEWSQRVRRTHVDENCEKLIDLLSHWTDDIIETLEKFGPKVQRQINEALQSTDDGPKFIDGSIVLHMSYAEEYHEEFTRLYGEE